MPKPHLASGRATTDSLEPTDKRARALDQSTGVDSHASSLGRAEPSSRDSSPYSDRAETGAGIPGSIFPGSNEPASAATANPVNHNGTVCFYPSPTADECFAARDSGHSIEWPVHASTADHIHHPTLYNPGYRREQCLGPFQPQVKRGWLQLGMWYQMTKRTRR